MDRCTFQPLDTPAAEEIVGWRYPEPYDVYNLDASALPALLAPEHAYHAVLEDQQRLIGFCCFGPDARVPGGDYRDTATLDVGAGLRPDLTGQHLGPSFLRAVLAFGRERFGATRFRATIAAFNHRALRAAAQAGFHRTATFKQGGPDGREFVVLVTGMALSAPDERRIVIASLEIPCRLEVAWQPPGSSSTR